MTAEQERDMALKALRAVHAVGGGRLPEVGDVHVMKAIVREALDEIGRPGNQYEKPPTCT